MARILITGSNSGFGKLAALTLARDGHDVIATMRNPANADAFLADAEGLSVEIRTLDVCDSLSVDAALHDAATIDVLVNNAGYEVQSAVEQLSDEILLRQLDTNVVGPMRCIRAVMPAWRNRGSGVIVNVSSIAGRVGSPYAGAYSASKFALEGMTESLHFEVSTAGVRVHLIEPGSFATGFQDKIVRPDAWPGSIHEERAHRFRDARGALHDPTAPAPDPQDVADAIVRAATDPTMPFRTLVGSDAELIDGVKASMSFEDFETAMRSTLDWHD